MRINECQKKGCNKVVDSKKNPLKLKLYPPLKNAMEGVYLVKGEKILEYRGKGECILEAKAQSPSSTLVLHGVHTFQHKQKKEKMLPLKIHKVIHDTKFVVFCKK
jgi:hypothetical protein